MTEKTFIYRPPDYEGPIAQQEYQSKDDEFRFSKTIVPVKLAQYGNENLVSRSQAKRLLVGVELFQVVILDFDGVKTIGQSFSDEVFRVFTSSRPGIKIHYINANPEIERMIDRAKRNVIE